MINTNFKKLFLAQLVSSLGDWIAFIIAPVALTRLGDLTGFWASAIVISKFLPAILLPFVKKSLKLEFDAKKTMLLSDLLRAILFLLFFVVKSPAAICLLLFVLSAGNAFFNPARSSFLIHIVPKNKLFFANARMATAIQSMILLGPALGGIVVGLFSNTAAILINSASFLVSFALILSIQDEKALMTSDPQEKEKEGAENIIADEKIDSKVNGNVASKSKSIPSSIQPYLWTEFLSTIAFGSLNVFFQIKAFKELLLSPQEFGVMMSFLGGGLFLASLVAPRLEKRIGDLRLYLLGMFLGGFLLYGFAFGQTLPVLCLFLFWIGFFNTFQDVSAITLIQKDAANSESSMDYIFEFLQSSISLAIICGVGLAGIGTEKLGLHAILGAYALLPILSAMVLFFKKRKPRTE